MKQFKGLVDKLEGEKAMRSKDLRQLNIAPSGSATQWFGLFHDVGYLVIVVPSTCNAGSRSQPGIFPGFCVTFTLRCLSMMMLTKSVTASIVPTPQLGNRSSNPVLRNASDRVLVIVEKRVGIWGRVGARSCPSEGLQL